MRQPASFALPHHSEGRDTSPSRASQLFLRSKMPNVPTRLEVAQRIRRLLSVSVGHRKGPTYLIAMPKPSRHESLLSKEPEDAVEDSPTTTTLSWENSMCAGADSDRPEDPTPAKTAVRNPRGYPSQSRAQDPAVPYPVSPISVSNMSETSTLVSSPHSDPSACLLHGTPEELQLSDPSALLFGSSRKSTHLRVQRIASKWTGKPIYDIPEDPHAADDPDANEYKTSTWGKFKDDVRKARKDKWTAACIKATSRFCAAPDEKQLRIILAGLREGGKATDRDQPLGAILHQLRVRLDSSDWTVVLKAQIVFHTVLRSGNRHLVDYLACALPNMFETGDFDDMSAGGVVHTPFITTYAIYLQRWLAMRAGAMFPPAKTIDPNVKKHFNEASAEEILTGLPLLMDTVSTLLKFDLHSRLRRSPVANAALFLLLRDQDPLITALSNGIDRLVELFYGMRREQAIRSLATYVRYRQLMGGVRIVIEKLQKVHPGWYVPCDVSAESLTHDMQRYIDENLSGGRRGRDLQKRMPDRVVPIGRAPLPNGTLPHARTPHPHREQRRRVLSQIEFDNDTEYSY